MNSQTFSNHYFFKLFLILLSSFFFISSVCAEDGYSNLGNGTIKVQNDFDYTGPPVQNIGVNGRTVYYIDEGPKTGIPVLLIWGGGTSIRGLRLTDHLRTLRHQLGIRIISVEQNGMGESQLDTSLDLDDYVDEILAVLDYLNVDKFSVFAASIGGPPTGYLVSRVGDRIRSLHLASAYQRPTDINNNTILDSVNFFCTQTLPDLNDLTRFFAFTPKSWWNIGPDVPNSVPGFADASYEEGLYNFLVNGQGLLDPSDPNSAGKNLTHQVLKHCPGIDGLDLTDLKSPMFIYHGDADGTVSPDHVPVAELFYSNASSVIKRIYPGEGHDSSRLHFDQVLTDIKFINGDRTVVCNRNINKSFIQKDSKAMMTLNSGGTLGICGWDR